LPTTGRPAALAWEHQKILFFKITSLRVAPKQISGRLFLVGFTSSIPLGISAPQDFTVKDWFC
jgi:hypothetical protein